MYTLLDWGVCKADPGSLVQGRDWDYRMTTVWVCPQLMCLLEQGAFRAGSGEVLSKPLWITYPTWDSLPPSSPSCCFRYKQESSRTSRTRGLHGWLKVFSLPCYLYDFKQVLGNFPNVKSSNKNWGSNKCPPHRDVNFRKHEDDKVPDQSEILSDG